MSTLRHRAAQLAVLPAGNILSEQTQERQQQALLKVVEFEGKMAEISRLLENHEPQHVQLLASIARAHDSGMIGAPSPRRTIVAPVITIYGIVMNFVSAQTFTDPCLRSLPN